jgi:hypothetical protein
LAGAESRADFLVPIFAGEESGVPPQVVAIESGRNHHFSETFEEIAGKAGVVTGV